MTTPSIPWTEHEAALVAALDGNGSPEESDLVTDALAEVRERIARDAQSHSEDGRESE